MKNMNLFDDKKIVTYLINYKRHFKALLVLILSLFQIAVAQSSELPSLIKINQTLEKTIDANLMILNLEIWSRDKSSEVASKKMNELQSELKNILSVNKIDLKSIDLGSMSLYPEMIYDSKIQQSQFAYYQARQSLTLKLKEIEKLNTLQMAITKLNQKNFGITLNNTEWTSSEKETLENQLSEEAIKLARKRAESLAKAAQVEIKGVYSISTQQNSTSFESAADLRFSGVQAKALGAHLQSENSSLSQPGKIKVRSEVYIEYLIKN